MFRCVNRPWRYKEFLFLRIYNIYLTLVRETGSKPPLYRVFRVRYAKRQLYNTSHFQYKCYMNVGTVVKHYVAMSVLMLQDTVRCCTVSFLMNCLHAYAHLWQTLLPHTWYACWLRSLACEVTAPLARALLFIEAREVRGTWSSDSNRRQGNS